MAKTNPQDYDINGCMTMVGAHIKSCIDDYAYMHKHYDAALAKLVKKRNNRTSSKFSHLARRLENYDTAKHFIFGGLLEEQINMLGLELDANFVKRLAMEKAGA